MVRRRRAPNPALAPINLSIGEPRHPTPELLLDALAAAARTIAHYPMTIGTPALREAIAGLARAPPRTGPPSTRRARCCRSWAAARRCSRSRRRCSTRIAPGQVVVMPNPFYQIYEGAALLGGATPVPRHPASRRAASHRPGTEVPDGGVGAHPAGLRLLARQPHRPRDDAGRMAERCSNSPTATASSSPPTSATPRCTSTRPGRRWAPLAAAQALGRDGFPRLVTFGSLSKRSNAPGLRSGYVAGDAALVKAFLLYRTYHGSAMSPAVAAASRAAWNDEAHVRANRRRVRREVRALQPRLAPVLPCTMPEAAFYLWARTPIDDAEFARRLLRRAQRHGAAGQLPRPQRRRRQSRLRLRPHRAGRRPRRVRRGDRAHRRLRPPSLTLHALRPPAAPRRRRQRPVARGWRAPRPRPTIRPS